MKLLTHKNDMAMTTARRRWDRIRDMWCGALFFSPEENQYESLRRVLGIVLQRQIWKVEQISFIAGARSLNEQDLRENLKFFQVPEVSIVSILWTRC
jgi:hypothetical protein